MAYTKDNIEFLPKPTTYNFKDITCQTFARLTALAYVGRSKFKHTLWLFECTCGTLKILPSFEVVRGVVRSCGCIKSQSSSFRTHGLSGKRVHGIWKGVLSRCRNKNEKRYGGRGIEVCDRWLDFENFYADMGDPPSSEHSIERKDNNGNYCPENCKWALRTEQANNRRSNRVLTINGTSKSLTDWVRQYGSNYGRTLGRLEHGWDPYLALTLPKGSRKPVTVSDTSRSGQ
jgi:hypothetical protein